MKILIDEKKNNKLMYTCDSWRKFKKQGYVTGYGELYNKKSHTQYYKASDLSLASIYTLLFR